MRLLILGAAGMLGHKLFQTASSQGMETWGTVRGDPARFESLLGERLDGGTDATRFHTIARHLEIVHPDVVVNCIGVVKQVLSDDKTRLVVNGLFPLQLADLCKATGVRLIQISTDCVFSGERGGYTETDRPDPVDTYGYTKLLGEAKGCLVLRTSMVGRELNSCRGLLEWFLSQKGKKVFGYSQHIFSGLTTAALSATLLRIIQELPALTGIYHVSSEPISKFDLLNRFNGAYGCEVIVQEEVTQPSVDRSLNSAKFQSATGWTYPSWEAMIEGLVRDPTPYDRWRSK